ncbi:hypothetical protein SISNIDRAFT_552553 [Sistotremastrum niveocremeum HHB9708]|uniref:DUF3533 domain-containing protein n=1 Tax=Sistotremastrum niveocremeum HHB9708 TaxID=1314777 RepID=A0A164P8M4_9AGAM|nr:hypothetical protein SISNIDRAFT_552553 [Sistotremastrum niveocremeum HHB9708]
MDLKPYQHTFWSPELAAVRALYLKIIVRCSILIILVMWAFLPLYWGSLASSTTMTPNLTAYLIDRDRSAIGQAVSAVFASSTQQSATPALGWVNVDPDVMPKNADVVESVLDERAWIAVVVNTNATQKLLHAQTRGDTSYDPTTAITLFYSQSRNEIISSNILFPILTSLLQSASSHVSANLTSQYLVSLASAALANSTGTAGVGGDGSPDADGLPGSGNWTAIEALARAPLTISGSVAWKWVNLRPYNAPVAQAVTLVGQIYLCIFGFIITMANDAARAHISPYLKLSSYLILRIAVPLLAYIPLSLSYAMINLPFHLPFGTKYVFVSFSLILLPSFRSLLRPSPLPYSPLPSFSPLHSLPLLGSLPSPPLPPLAKKMLTFFRRFTYAQGFITFWAFVWMGMASLGLATEAVVTVLQARFMAFFLVPMIIANVSVAALPNDVQPSLYKYGEGFPVYNMSLAIRTILFNTKNSLGRNAGVLIAWIALSIGTICLGTVLQRRRELRYGKKARHLHGGHGGGGMKSKDNFELEEGIGKGKGYEMDDLDKTKGKSVDLDEIIKEKERAKGKGKGKKERSARNSIVSTRSSIPPAPAPAQAPASGPNSNSASTTSASTAVAAGTTATLPTLPFEPSPSFPSPAQALPSPPAIGTSSGIEINPHPPQPLHPPQSLVSSGPVLPGSLETYKRPTSSPSSPSSPSPASPSSSTRNSTTHQHSHPLRALSPSHIRTRFSRSHAHSTSQPQPLSTSPTSPTSSSPRTRPRTRHRSISRDRTRDLIQQSNMNPSTTPVAGPSSASNTRPTRRADRSRGRGRGRSASPRSRIASTSRQVGGSTSMGQRGPVDLGEWEAPEGLGMSAMGATW